MSALFVGRAHASELREHALGPVIVKPRTLSDPRVLKPRGCKLIAVSNESFRLGEIGRSDIHRAKRRQHMQVGLVTVALDVDNKAMAYEYVDRLQRGCQCAFRG